MQRNEWLNYDEWVPVNVAGTSGLHVTAAPGYSFGAGYLQIAGFSVQWTAPAFRTLEAVDLRTATLGCIGGGMKGHAFVPFDCLARYIPYLFLSAFVHPLGRQFYIAGFS